MIATTTYALDASALLAVLHREPGSGIVLPLVDRSVMSTINWSETVQKTAARGVSTAGLRGDVEAVGLRILPFTVDEAEIAAALWTRTRHLGLSLGDRACLALGRRLGLWVVTADRAWTTLDLGVPILAIRA